MARLVAEGFLEQAPGRRLRPGPAFSRDRPPHHSDAVDEAVNRWVKGYGEELRGYELTSRILRLARLIEVGIDRNAAAEGLTSGEVLVLDALYRIGPPHRAAPTALKQYFLLSLAGVGKRVDRLAQLELVERMRDPDDGRSLLVQLSEKGRETLARLAEGDRTAPYLAWTKNLSPIEHAALADLFKDAEQSIEQAGDGREPREDQ